MLNLVEELAVEVGELLQPLIRSRICRRSNETIVPHRFAFLGLFGFDHPQQTRRHQAADEGRLVHQDKNIERISIAPERVGQEPKVVGEKRPHRQNSAVPEELPFFIPGKFVPAAFWCVDDNIELARFRIERRQMGKGDAIHLALISFTRGREDVYAGNAGACARIKRLASRQSFHCNGNRRPAPANHAIPICMGRPLAGFAAGGVDGKTGGIA